MENNINDYNLTTLLTLAVRSMGFNPSQPGGGLTSMAADAAVAAAALGVLAAALSRVKTSNANEWLVRSGLLVKDLQVLIDTPPVPRLCRRPRV